MAHFQHVKTSGSEPPLLAVFPSGIPSVVADESDFPFQYMAPASSDRHKQKGSYIYAEDDQLRFVGSTSQPYNLSQPQFNYAVGYFDPKKPKKVKLVEATGLYTVQQLSVRDTSSTIDNGAIKQLQDGEANMRTQLTEQFGSRKRKRQLRSEESGRVTIETNTASLQALTTQLDVIGGDEKHASLLQQKDSDLFETRRQMLPPFDIDATSVDNIYIFSKLFFKSKWSLLNARESLYLTPVHIERKLGKKAQKAKKAKKGDDSSDDDDDDEDDEELLEASGKAGTNDDNSDDDEETIEEYQNRLSAARAKQQKDIEELPRFIKIRRERVANALQLAQDSNDPYQKDFSYERLIRLSFTLYLLRLLTNKKATKGTQEMVECLKCPQAFALWVKSYFFNNDMFSNNNKKTRIRIFCHFLVMTILCADDFTITKQELTALSEDLMQGVSQLCTLYRTCGCQATSEKVRLTAPLKLEALGSTGGSARR